MDQVETINIEDLDPYSVDPFAFSAASSGSVTKNHESLSDDSEEEPEPDVEDIVDKAICSDNHTSCVSSEIAPLLEVFDQETCTGLLIGYYDAYKDIKLDPKKTSASIAGCEFDYSSNTYRLHVTLSSGSVTVGDNFIIVKVDGASGFPKVLSIR